MISFILSFFLSFGLCFFRSRSVRSSPQLAPQTAAAVRSISPPSRISVRFNAVVIGGEPISISHRRSNCQPPLTKAKSGWRERATAGKRIRAIEPGGREGGGERRKKEKREGLTRKAAEIRSVDGREEGKRAPAR